MSHYHNGRLAEPFKSGGDEYYLHWRGCEYLVIQWDAGGWDAFPFRCAGEGPRNVELGEVLEYGGPGAERIRRGLEPWDAGHERLWSEAGA